MGRTVPVLLNVQLKECIELLLENRTNAKVRERNPYLFGIPGYDKHRFKHLRACPLMRTYSLECGAANPFTLRGTQLRKHIATMCVTLNLSEEDVSELANFMGHDKSIHKSHYRQPIPELEIPRIAHLLQLATDINHENETSIQNEVCALDKIIPNNTTNNEVQAPSDSDDEDNDKSNSVNKRQKKRRSSKYIRNYLVTIQI